MSWVKPAVTKFTAPLSPPAVIERPALCARLDSCSELPLALVAGSPGIGKSVLLGSWRRSRPDLRTAWLTCDSWDSEALRFWASVISAYGTVEPGIGRDALDLLEEGPAAVEEVVASLINDLAQLDPPVRLIIDDLHVVPAPAMDGLATFIERLPGGWGLVVGTRSDPVLPLHRWRSWGSLGEIRDAELRLQPAEVAAMTVNFGLTLSPENIRLLDSRTEGWAAGVQLASLSLQKEPDPGQFLRAFAGTHQVVADFLFTEALARQPAPMVEFLKATSIVDEFDAELAASLLPGEDVHGLGREAVASGLFIVPQAGDPPTYRYHQLFRDFLRAELAADGRARRRALHVQAAGAYEERGDYAAALGNLVSAGEVGRAIEILHERLITIWFAGSGGYLVQVLDQLSDVDLHGREAGVLDYAIALGLLGHIEEMGRWLERARAVIAPADARLHLRLATADVIWHWLQGDPGPATAMRRERRDTADEHPDPTAAEALPNVYARAALISGPPDRAVEICRESMASGHLNARLEAITRGVLSRALFERGELEAARAAADTAMGSARHHGFAEHVGMFEALLTEAGLAAEADRLDDAERTLETALRRCERIRPPFELLALVEMAGLMRARQEAGAALSVLERARAALPPGVSSPLWERVDGCEARVRIEQGNTERATALISRLRPSESRTALEVRIALAEGRLDAAERLLSGGVPAAGTPRQVLESALLGAAVAAGAGLDPGDHLQRVLEIARRYGFVVSVLDGPPLITQCLVDLLRRSPADAVTERLLEVADRVALRRSEVSSAIEDLLSEREQDVLRYLPTRLSTREISDELFISMNTLKSHLKSIYRKLDATSRGDAVARSKVLGLV